MIATTKSATFLADLDTAISKSRDPAAEAMRLLADTFSHYRWVGIYWLEQDELVLGPFVGAPTEHQRIPVGRGVCGTAVAEGKNQIVADVRQLRNYLACSLETRSEIVVLIRKAGQIIGQIDADGDEEGAFDATDEALLTAVAERLAARVPEPRRLDHGRVHLSGLVGRIPGARANARQEQANSGNHFVDPEEKRHKSMGISAMTWDEDKGHFEKPKQYALWEFAMAEIRLGRAEVERGRLPKVCMACGRRASVKRKKAFRWSPLWTMLVGGWILARIMSKTMTIHAPFCKGHRNHWLMRTLLSVLAFIGVVVVDTALLFVVAAKSAAHGPEDKPMLIALGFAGALLLAWFILVIVVQQTAIRVKEITDKSMTLAGVNQSFISALRDLREERQAGGDERVRVARRRPQLEEEDDSDEDD